MWKLNMCPSLYHYRVINEPFLLKQLFMRPSVAITQGLFIKGSQKENTWKMRQWAYFRTLSFLQLLKFEKINFTYIFVCGPGAEILAVSSSWTFVLEDVRSWLLWVSNSEIYFVQIQAFGILNLEFNIFWVAHFIIIKIMAEFYMNYHNSQT